MGPVGARGHRAGHSRGRRYAVCGVTRERPLTPAGKRYTLILKDALLPPNPDDGREQSTVSYEYDFTARGAPLTVFVPWAAFKPTYRGREKKDAPDINLRSVRRISLMMRR